MQLESPPESMIKTMNGARANMYSLEGFYFDENNNYKEQIQLLFQMVPLMRVSYSGLLTNMRANGILLSGKHTVI